MNTKWNSPWRFDRDVSGHGGTWIRDDVVGPVIAADAPYGYKADGSPRGKPGRKPGVPQPKAKKSAAKSSKVAKPKKAAAKKSSKKVKA